MLRHYSLNVLAGAVSNLTSAALGLITIPFLVSQLGTESYGVWALVVLIVSYITLMDFGVIIATGRQMAASRALKDQDGVDRTMISALTICAGVALVGVLISVLVAAGPQLIFNIPPHILGPAREAIIISGVGVGIYFLYAPLNCLLWAHERLDIAGAIEVVVQATRAAAIFSLVRGDSSIALLSLITLGGHLLAGALLLLACRTAIPGFRIPLRLVPWHELRQLFAQGLSFFAVSATRTLPGLAALTAIGNQLSPTEVTAYSVARQLITYAQGLMMAGSQIAQSRAVALNALEDHGQQRQLYAYGAILSTAFAFLITGGLVGLGESFMQLWQGGRLDHAYPLLVLLAIGEALPMSQWVTFAVLLGMRRHGPLVLFALMESLVVFIGCILVADWFGLPGACAVMAAGALTFRGILLWRYGLDVIGYGAGRYIRRILLPLTVITAGLTLLFLWGFESGDLRSWPVFLGATAGFTVGFALLTFLAYRARILRA